MVKIIFHFSGIYKELNCNSNVKMKLIFEQWAKENGKEYKIIGKNVINDKIVYDYNFEFFRFQKLLNPELTLTQQLSLGGEILIIVKEKKYNEINIEDLKNEILEEIKSPKFKPTYEKVKEQIVEFGYLKQKEIEKELKENPDYFIKIEDALKQKNLNEQLYTLGRLGESLEKMGIKVVIDKRNSKNKENVINNQFISSGLLNQSKYEMHIKDNQKVNINKILYDKKEKSYFILKWVKILSSELNIPEDKIYITNVREGSIVFDVIFKTKDFTDLGKTDISFNTKIEDLTNSHPEIISIYERNIMGGCKLTLDMLDSRGNQAPGFWAKPPCKRGNIIYNPPDDNWIGFGLKVLGEYDNNDDWIGSTNKPNEWTVAYHGTNENAIKPICSKNGKFFSTKKEGAKNQKCFDCPNKNPKSKASYDKCGEGAYCSPLLNYAERYAKRYNNGVILMCRVNPKEFRIPEGEFEEKEWITDGTRNSIRPYRILYRINKEEK